jgi:hypothetical protein
MLPRNPRSRDPSNDEVLVSMLCGAGFNINTAFILAYGDNYGKNTPVDFALDFGEMVRVKIFVDHGAQITERRSLLSQILIGGIAWAFSKRSGNTTGKARALKDRYNEQTIQR